MSDWRVGSGEATAGQRFILDRPMLRRVPLSLGAAVGRGQARRFQTTAAVKRVEGIVKVNRLEPGRKAS